MPTGAMTEGREGRVRVQQGQGGKGERGVCEGSRRMEERERGAWATAAGAWLKVREGRVRWLQEQGGKGERGVCRESRGKVERERRAGA